MLHPPIFGNARTVETKLSRLPLLANHLGVADEHRFCQHVAGYALGSQVIEDVDDHEALTAGQRLIASVQHFLAGREGERLDLDLAIAVGALQGLGVLVCRARGGGRHLIAKRAQLAAADGFPLTVCVGKVVVVATRPQPGTAGRIPIGPDGCGIVCRDTIQLRGGRMWRTCCVPCERKKRRRTAERYVLSLMRDVRRGVR